MSIEQLLPGLLAAAVLAVVISLAALATAVVARREAEGGPGSGPGGRDPRGDAGTGSALPDGGSPIHRVARIVSFLYLASVAVVVAVTGAWPETQTAVFMLLALGTLLVVLFLDMLPEGWMGRARRPVEAVGALVFIGAITGLTGGIESPFYAGFFLVVAGTALSIEGRAPIVIALTAALIYAVVALVASAPDLLAPAGLGWIAFNAVALILLADVATVAGGIQRQAQGLFNRSYLLTTIEQEIRRSNRQGRGFSLLMLDLDDLKPVNDTFGHPTGDRLLRAIADVIQRTVRFTDSASRYGGDEFMVLLPETDAAGAYIVAEKLRRDVGALSIRATNRSVRTSVSIGLVTFPEDGATIEQLVSAVDVAMYEAKRHGKNQIVGYTTRTERVATAIEPERPSAVVLAVEGAERFAPAGGSGRVGPIEVPAPGEGMAPRDAVILTMAPGGTRPVPAAAMTRGTTPEAAVPGAMGERATVIGDAPWSTRTRTASLSEPASDGTRAGAWPPTQVAVPVEGSGGGSSGASGVGSGPAGGGGSGAAGSPPRGAGDRRADEVRTPEARTWIALPVDPAERAEVPGSEARGGEARSPASREADDREAEPPA